MQKTAIILALSLFGTASFSSCQHTTDSPTTAIDSVPLAEGLEAAPEGTEAFESSDTTGRDIEMVFCLDATSSMSGLIGTAKEKIWSIVSEVAQGSDVRSLKLGMVFYRDRTDGFTTLPIPLTGDLDSVYTELLGMQAVGGGDAPESVNQALNEAVTAMGWSEDRDVYRTIFVVGDCPPHMDYKDDVKYTVSCQKAAAMGITINTIKLGESCFEAIAHFKKMAECSNGEYLKLGQEARDVVIATPYDKTINEVSRKIDNSRMYYGTAVEQRMNNDKKAKSMEVYNNGSITANSDRSSYKNSKAGRSAWMGQKELVSAYANNTVELDSIAEEQLPKELQGKTTAEKAALLKKTAAERTANKNELTELTKQRQKYIEAERSKKGEKGTSFSTEVVVIMKKQAERK